MRTGLLFLIGTALLAGDGLAQRPIPEPDEAAARRFVSPTLTRFRGEAEFRAYLRSLGVAIAGRYDPPLDTGQVVEVTGTRIRAPNIESNVPIVSVGANAVRSQGFTGGDALNDLPQLQSTFSQALNPAITNTQEANVDEGDIVKQVGRFLLVLQDGRVFSVDLAPHGRPGLALADRIDVYRSRSDDAWYDEMLVHGDRVVITGYSYEREASQIVVLRVAPDGRLSREGTFLLTSNDYYDVDNYATRLVGDRLIIYTPILLHEGDRFVWPTLRRWQRTDRAAPRHPLFDARAIHRPIVHDAETPALHTLSVCRLGPEVRGLGCETTAFVAPGTAELYVTPTDAFLWVSGDQRDPPAGSPRCSRRARPDEVNSAFVYRLALPGGGLSVAGARGTPVDQLSLAAIGGKLHALVTWEAQACGGDARYGDLAFATIPLSAFGRTRADAPARAYAAVPGLGGASIENRYNGGWLVYGGRPGWGSSPPAQAPAPQPLVVLPVARPREARTLNVTHGILRVERVGGDMVATGYRDRSGLDFTMIALDGTPRLGATLHLEGRYESEGRSHAFNARPEADGGALMGVPTVPRSNDAERWWFRSGASDLSFVSLGADGRL
ncbi:MAG TPA: beta-propeller domain-containing protein, partial [Allosphingosinicella sp.]|nr:beta-propeller domain-containing protein [Allosphingosinicella sp.]